MRSRIKRLFMINNFIIFLNIFLCANSSNARVFRMANETVAAYFGASYSPSDLKQTHFSGTSGGLTFEKSVLSNYGGEFGVLFTSKVIGMRLGVELIKPTNLTALEGLDTNAQKLYDFESSISALVPKLSLEFNFKTTDTWRIFLALGGGTATASYKNTYVLNTAGLAAYPGVTDFIEEGTATALLYDGGLGFEGLMNDTTTAALTLGYRQLFIPGYKYKTAVTDFNGTHAVGDSVLNDDGTVKTSKFSGATASLLFRFYLGK